MPTANNEGKWILDEKKNAIDWYWYGIETGDDSIARFVMHWIAFNWLYSEVQRRGDRAKIKGYCSAHYDDLKSYNPWKKNPEATAIFENQPVLNMSGEPSNDDPVELQELIRDGYGFKRVRSLLLAIYQVRCNLFHGSKTPRDERDRELVRSSATIMEGYLRALLSASNRQFAKDVQRLRESTQS